MFLFGRKWVKQYDQTVFDLIDMDQFRSSSCRYVFGYLFMYIMILVSLAVYASDIYTALVLLAFDRWSSSIQPFVPFRISRWIFGGCIILSLLLLIYEFIVAIHTMRGKNVALNYTNPIARNLYSIYGYKYFCLFAKITKSRSKTEYLALFVYFSFKGWLRLLFADSPRQVLNALTLYSVLKISDDFVHTVKHLAQSSLVEAVVISFMAFSLFIWVLSVIQFLIALLVACPLYVHIDKSTSGLEEYCFVRINRRIAQIVAKHHKKGLVQLKLANQKLKKQPTLPDMQMEDPELHSSDASFDDILARKDSNSSFNPMSSNSNLLDRKVSNSSDTSHDSNYLNRNPFQNAYLGEFGSSNGRSGYGFSEPSNSSETHLLQPMRNPSRNNSVDSLGGGPPLQNYPIRNASLARPPTAVSNAVPNPGGPGGPNSGRAAGSAYPIPLPGRGASPGILRTASNGIPSSRGPPRNGPPNSVRFAQGPAPVLRSASQPVRNIVQQPPHPGAMLQPNSVTYQEPSPTSDDSFGRNLTTPQPNESRPPSIPMRANRAVSSPNQYFPLKRDPVASSKPKPMLAPIQVSPPPMRQNVVAQGLPQSHPSHGLPQAQAFADPLPSASSSVYTEQDSTYRDSVDTRAPLPATHYADRVRDGAPAPSYPALVASPSPRMVHSQSQTTLGSVQSQQPTLPTLSPESMAFPTPTSSHFESHKSMPFEERLQPGSLVHRAEPPAELVDSTQPTLPNIDAYALD